MSRVSAFSFVEPQLPSLVDQPPEGAQWIHEVKHDGYRTLLAVQRGSVVAYTRNGFDWTDRYPRIVQAAAKLHCRSAILDGEVIVQDRHGASDFEALQAALKSKRTPLIFYAFDLLHLDGKDYRNVPLVERRTKCFTESDFILLGIDRDRKTGAHRALLAKEERVYAGAAFIALASEARERFASKLDVLAQERPLISWLKNQTPKWVRPE